MGTHGYRRAYGSEQWHCRHDLFGRYVPTFQTPITNKGLMTFAADVGGFFGNPEPEMLVRWYQVGIFAPFFRAHAHIDTKRREPYLLDEPYKGIVKKFLKLRYSMLPVWYTLFREASVSGVPILRLVTSSKFFTWDTKSSFQTSLCCCTQGQERVWN